MSMCTDQGLPNTKVDVSSLLWPNGWHNYYWYDRILWGHAYGEFDIVSAESNIKKSWLLKWISPIQNIHILKASCVFSELNSPESWRSIQFNERCRKARRTKAPTRLWVAQNHNTPIICLLDTKLTYFMTRWKRTVRLVVTKAYYLEMCETTILSLISMPYFTKLEDCIEIYLVPVFSSSNFQVGSVIHSELVWLKVLPNAFHFSAGGCSELYRKHDVSLLLSQWFVNQTSFKIVLYA
jgi:hypothetical protein